MGIEVSCEETWNSDLALYVSCDGYVAVDVYKNLRMVLNKNDFSISNFALIFLKQ